MRDRFPRLSIIGASLVLALTVSATSVQADGMAPGQRNVACESPSSIDDGWTTASPNSVGMDGMRLCSIAARLDQRATSVHSVVVVRHGKLVFEQYFPGYDQPWGQPDGQHEFTATTKHDMRSASKSVASLLVGIAIDRKLIEGVDEPVLKFFPDHQAAKQAGWEAITLRHLLTMSSGIEWDEARSWTDPKNDEPHLTFEADPIGYVLAKPVAAPPDVLWTYNGGGTELLGNILERVSGKPLEAFAREVLFQPLGISDFEWKAYKNGKIAAAAGLRLRPRDAAKIGQLVLNRGQWNGRQIVSADWIAQSTTPRFQAIGYFGSTMFYGYQWWMGRSLAGDKEIKWVAAFGWGGQRIFIVPELDLVMMTTAAQYGQPKEGLAAIDILTNIVIPSVRDAH
ncbi:beta-lactamase family protein [Bradyrhizobium barranii subsp. apii]|uniref:Beta-lactamase family protein n=1 Tax=Bradyrhizobium barranii subsp. apii TaxID=2819348 RepID=A0A8T5UXM5_9BRAD|nr:serine hydrolase [Bradyrhizobium barranii]UPT86760.1 beta-lactamase family protein [Bradyrhizobium barranii subsp. apii]UPT95739.1 beta-lactamase family protein [Bradyrhizobium barranii subsp. apii]